MHGKYNIEWRYVQECLRMWKWEHFPPFEEGDNFTPSLKRNVEVCQVDGRGVGLGGGSNSGQRKPHTLCGMLFRIHKQYRLGVGGRGVMRLKL